MSLEVDAFQEFLYVDEALQILIRFVRQMLPFCKEWKDRCVWFTYFQKIPTICQSTFVCFPSFRWNKNHQVLQLEPRFSGKSGVFPWEVHPKDRQFHIARFVQGDVTTSNASGKPNGRHARIGLGIWKHGTFF